MAQPAMRVSRHQITKSPNYRIIGALRSKATYPNSTTVMPAPPS